MKRKIIATTLIIGTMLLGQNLLAQHTAAPQPQVAKEEPAADAKNKPVQMKQPEEKMPVQPGTFTQSTAPASTVAPVPAATDNKSQDKQPTTSLAAPPAVQQPMDKPKIETLKTENSVVPGAVPSPVQKKE